MSRILPVAAVVLLLAVAVPAPAAAEPPVAFVGAATGYFTSCLSDR